jgi:hypothetical protein
MLAALGGIAASLGLPGGWDVARDEPAFTGPLPGNDADPEHLARACWALVLLMEVIARARWRRPWDRSGSSRIASHPQPSYSRSLLRPRCTGSLRGPARR